MTQLPPRMEVDAEAQLQNVEETHPNPFEEIRAMDADSRRQELETLNGGSGGADRAPSRETTQGEPALRSGETATSPDTGGAGVLGKRPGIDVVLNDVESQLSPEHADVIRGVLTGYHKTQAEWKDQQGVLKDLINDMEQMKATQAGPVEQDPNDPLTSVTPAQWALFNRMLEQQGIPSRDELAQQETEESQRDYVSDDIDKGIEQWGDAFGHRSEDGKFIYNIDIQDQMQSEFDRLYDPSRGPTAMDLFKIVHMDKMVAEAEEKGRQDGQTSQSNGAAEKVNRAIRGVVERTSASSVNPAPVIYDRDKDRKRGGSIDLDTVVARASLAAMRKLPSLPQ